MSSNSTPVRSALCKDDPHRDRAGIPAAVAGDSRGEPATSVGCSHQVIDVDEFGLELDDEQDSSDRMPREDVDHSAFSVDRE